MVWMMILLYRWRSELGDPGGGQFLHARLQKQLGAVPRGDEEIYIEDEGQGTLWRVRRVVYLPDDDPDIIVEAEAAGLASKPGA